MRNASVLSAALEIVEERLREPLTAPQLARACYSSCSGLQKLFAYAFHCPVSEYITKRRLTCAARELVASDRTVTDVALDYGYGSPEAFSRAFRRFWGVSPALFRRTRRFTELWPKFTIQKHNGGFAMSTRKPVDISKLYDEFRRLGGTYVLCADIINFDSVNKTHGRAAGDLGIAQAFARLESSLSEDMLLFRIGGDEFAVVTGYTALEDAEELARAIVSRNGEVICMDNAVIPLSLRIGISKIPDHPMRYQQALEAMAASIDKARAEASHIAIWE